MNGTRNDSGDALYSDQESKNSDSEGENPNIKNLPYNESTMDRIEDESNNWSRQSNAGSSEESDTEGQRDNMNITLESDMSGPNMDPLSSSRKNSNNISRSPSPSEDSRNADGLENSTIHSVNLDNKSRSPSPNEEDKTRPESPVDPIELADPIQLGKRTSSVRSGSGSPSDSKRVSMSGYSSSMDFKSGAASPVEVRSRSGSPVEVKSGTSSPVDINSDSEMESSEDEKEVNTIDSESEEDDCVVVEESPQGKNKQKTPVKPMEVVEEKKVEEVVSKEEKTEEKQQNGKTESDTDKATPVKTPTPEPAPVRRSLRNTQRKVYKDPVDDETSGKSTDSEPERTKAKSRTPQKPSSKVIGSNIVLLPRQSPLVQQLTPIRFPNTINRPMNTTPINKAAQNGVVPRNVLNNMASRGVSITSPSMRINATPPQQQPKPVPKKQPPFPPDSIFANMVNESNIIEAPSFLSPFIFVNKPAESLKKFVDEIGKEIEEERKKEEEERKKEEKERQREEDERKKEEEERRIEEEKEKEEERLLKEEQDKEKSEELAKSAQEGGEPMEVDEEGKSEGAGTKEGKSEGAETKEGAVAKEGDEDKKEGDDDKNKEPKKVGRRRRKEDNDESWSENDFESSSSEEEEEDDLKTVILKDKPEDNLETLLKDPTPLVTAQPTEKSETATSENKTQSYFSTPLGNFFIDIGFNLVQERVQTDLLKLQERKRRYDRTVDPRILENAINLLSSNLQRLKRDNFPFNFSRVRCQFCSFKTESALVMANHMEVPHLAKNGSFRCNFCPLEVQSPQLILSHVSTEHGVAARLLKPQAAFECPDCPFESQTKGRYQKHVEKCTKLKIEEDILKPMEWQPPAKLIKASARPSYNYSYRPRMGPRIGQFRPQQPSPLGMSPNAIRAMRPPNPDAFNPGGAVRPRMGQIRPSQIMHRPATVNVKCGMCGSQFADAIRLREHVLKEHARIINAVTF